jgi:hypothetical protein
MSWLEDDVDLRDLLRFVGNRVALYGCDNTHRFTRDWAEVHDRDPEDVVALVERHGGMNCDCEVVMNVRLGNIVQLTSKDGPLHL